jgi:hypothetical protein
MAIAGALFRCGEPVVIEYTPSSGNVAAGSVVVLGNNAGICCGIAHKDIANNRTGALALGLGTYDCKNLNNAANWAKVYWDATNIGVTTTSTNNALFGFVCFGGGNGVNTTCMVLHHPYV